ncbi:MAG: NAD-dependent epimerase/dehydratase family protein [Saprospiraceae bacterium]
MSQKVIITGSTGMVGKGVLLECLESPVIEKVLLINRRSLNMSHPKIEEVLLQDFTKVAEKKDQLGGYDACFHCMGVSSVGMSEADYSHLTFDVTKALADVLYDHNPNAVFIYVSGTGTDGSEKGRVMWARVKGKTENYILNKGFKDAYAFRPGVILPEKGIKSRTGWYNAMYVIARPFFPLMRRSKNVTTTTRLGQAMINALSFPVESKLLENKEINELAGN